MGVTLITCPPITPNLFKPNAQYTECSVYRKLIIPNAQYTEYSLGRNPVMTWFKSPYRSMGQKHDSTPILNLSFTKNCYGFSESLLCREHRKRIKNTKSWPVLKIQNFPIHFAAYFKGQILKILMKKKLQDQILT